VSRKLRRTLLIVGGLVLLAAFLGLGLDLAAQHEPAFYREAVEIDAAAAEKQSDLMLQRATALASAVKKEDHWEALFTAKQINGWLAVDMIKNHPKTMPPNFSDPRVAIQGRRIIIACRCRLAGFNSVLSLTVEPYVPEPNMVLVRIIKARAGLLPLPLGGVLERISQVARDMQLHLKWRHAGGDPVAVLSFPSADGDRPVSIETLRLGDGEIYVAGSTERRKP
jgi:hypothetical protein